MSITIKFDQPFFDDIAPAEKCSDELIYLVLKQTRGDITLIKNYSRAEVEQTARKLVIEGFIRGTPLDNDKCVWSRLSRQGQRYLEILDREKLRNDF